MSEMREPTSAGEGYPMATNGSPLLRLGGGLGIAACLIGLLIFITGCAGMSKVLVLSLVPVGLSVPGLIVSIVAAVKDKALITEDTHVLQALFANAAGLLGGLVEMAAWLHWPIFHQ